MVEPIKARSAAPAAKTIDVQVQAYPKAQSCEAIAEATPATVPTGVTSASSSRSRHGYRKIAAPLAARRRLVGERQAGRVDLAVRGVEGHPEATQARPAVAKGWLVRPLAARASKSRVVYDFVGDRAHDGKNFRMLDVLDEFTHESLAIRVARKLKAINAIDVLSDLFWTW
jgi:hypothetical protein